ncbi:SIR2 family protein [Pseudoalteromonas sp. OOF1S-7]|uniref:nSTAND1 domain-containing NTPase n=1 Tax=Pseudoalteromonas sp. OOF1S-7 TaxID=2917757 RepID=UPI001EF5EC5A|nr:SIR2 family protein [Pseudoalteromonas sp. OOF1S-7]
MEHCREQLQQHFADFSAAEIEACTRFSEALQNKAATFFLGAGVSIPSGMRSGAEMVEEFQKRTGSDATCLRALCSVYEAQHSQYELRRLLMELLDDWNKPLSPIHRLIPRLNLKYLITVNVDRLVEESCRQQRLQHLCFSLPEDLGYARSDVLTLLKIHGTLEHPHTLVFSDNDYDRILHQDKEFEHKLKRLFQDNSVMTIGFTADEPDFNLLTNWLDERNDGKKVIALHLDEHQAQLCQREGVQPILIKDGCGFAAHQRIPILLGILGGIPVEQISLQNLEINRRANPFKRLEPYREEDCNKFIGRDVFLAECLRKLEAYHSVLLFGDSGCGKSSFVNAALLPGWKKDDRQVFIETVADDLPEQWQRITSKLDRHKPALIVLDQFERFFDHSSAQAKQKHFLTQTLKLEQQRNPNLYCLFVMRRDRIADLYPYKHLHPGLFTESLELTPLTQQDATKILVHHFALQGYDLDKNLALELVNYASKADTPYLPALQLYGFAQFESAEKARIEGHLEGNQVRTQSLSQENVISNFVADALSVLPAHLQHSLVISVLKQLTLHRHRQQITESQLETLFPEPEKAQAVLNTLVDKRLVVYIVEKRAWELVHDSLVTAIEDGPLAIEPDFESSEISNYLLDKQSQAGFSVKQIENLLKYSLANQLPSVEWANHYHHTGHSLEAKLLEFCRAPNSRLVTGTLTFIRHYPDYIGLSAKTFLSGYLLTLVEDTMWHEQGDMETGKAAMKLMLTLGLDDTALQFLLRYIDPFIDQHDDARLDSHRSLNRFDYHMMDLYLPHVLEVCSSRDLLKLGSKIFVSIQEIELGPERYAHILYALAVRGEMTEFITRGEYIAGLAEPSPLFEPEVVLGVLAQLPSNLPDTEKLDDLRQALLSATIYHGAPETHINEQLLNIMLHLGARRAEHVMFLWIQFYSRFGKAGNLWSHSRRVAATLLQDKQALKMFLQRLASSRSSSDLAAFTEIALLAQPCAGLNHWYREQTFSEFGVVSQLGYSLAQCLTEDFVDNQGVLVAQQDEYGNTMPQSQTPYTYWRAGQIIQASSTYTLNQKFHLLNKLASTLLSEATQLAEQTTIPGDCDEFETYRILDDFFEQSQVNDIELARAETIELLNRLPSELSMAPNSPTGFDEKLLDLKNALVALFVNHPHLNTPIERWPPFAWDPVYFTEMKDALKALQSVEELFERHTLPAPVDAALKAIRQLEAASLSDLSYYLRCYQWLKQTASECAALTGDPVHLVHFESLKEFIEDRTVDSVHFSSSLLIWALLVPWDTPPWFILYNNPMEIGICEDEEATRFIEALLRVHPDQVNKVTTDWAMTYLTIGLESESANLTEAGQIAALFESFCNSDWAPIYAKWLSDAALGYLLDSPFMQFQRAALKLWPLSDLDSSKGALVALAVDGNAELKPDAVTALNLKAHQDR